MTNTRAKSKWPKRKPGGIRKEKEAEFKKIRKVEKEKVIIFLPQIYWSTGWISFDPLFSIFRPVTDQPNFFSVLITVSIETDIHYYKFLSYQFFLHNVWSSRSIKSIHRLNPKVLHIYTADFRTPDSAIHLIEELDEDTEMVARQLIRYTEYIVY